MREIDKVLDDHEKVIWEGKPKFLPHVLPAIIILFIFGVFFGSFSVIAAISSSSGFDSLIKLVPLFIAFCISIVAPIYLILNYFKTYYAITNKRVLLQGGVIGRDFEMIDFDQITNSQVDVGIFDVIFGGNSGSISISSAGSFESDSKGRMVHAPIVLSNVFHPYDVFKKLKEYSHAVKSDIQFPNKYRPEDNSGYKTSYKR